MFLCGLYYDDFDEGGFAVAAICDSIENAMQIKEEMMKKYPKVKSNIGIKEFKINTLYNI